MSLERQLGMQEEGGEYSLQTLASTELLQCKPLTPDGSNTS